MKTRHAFLAAVLSACVVAAYAEPATIHEEKVFQAKPGGTFKVDASFHDVTVTLAQGTQVKVVVDVKADTWPSDAKEAIKEYAPVFKEEGDLILVRCRPAHGSLRFGYSRMNGSVDVTMPPGMKLVLDTGSGDIRVEGDTGPSDVTCESGSGDVSVSGTVRDLTIETGSGDVVVKASGEVGKTSIETGSGGVRFEGATAKIRVETGSGDVELSGLTGDARFDTGSGDVEAEWARVPRGGVIKADTGSGEVVLRLAADAVLGGILDTSSGTVRCDWPGTSDERGRRMALAGGAGAVTLDVDTGSGDITVVKKAG